jgi:hypothetical protein
MHRVKLPTRRLAACLTIAGALLVATVLNGCTSVAGSTPVSRVRVIDASSNAPALDAYISAAPIAIDVVGPSVTNYAYEGPGPATIKLDAHSSSTTTTVLQSLTATLEPNTQYSIFVADQGQSYTATMLTDQSTAAPSGDVSFRFLQQANATGRVDVYVVPDGTDLTKAKPLFPALAVGSTTNYINIPVGDYDIAIAPAGVTTGAYISTGTTFTSGQVRTVLILDDQLLNTPPVTILVANDVN